MTVIRFPLAMLLLLGCVAANAIVPSQPWINAASARIKEIDAALQHIRGAPSALSPEQQRDLLELQRSLKSERSLLIERQELLKRLEQQGLLMYAVPSN
jgi:hypothetical protein